MRALTAVFLALVLAACGEGPDERALERDVAGRLAQALPAGTVALASLERRGSQPDTRAQPGEKRRIVYFDAALKLERDYDFGAWDSPGVAGMVSALGAGPRGIVGLASGGNKAGDVLRAHGTVVYRREGEAWAPVAPGGYAPGAAPPYAAAAAAQGGPAGALAALRAAIEAVPRDVPAATREAIENEIAAAHAAVRAALARAADGYAIAAGPEHGQYWRFAQALSDFKGARVVALVTRGGEENLRLLREGKVALALSQADAALAAYEGRDGFAPDGPYATLRAIGSLYPEPVHVLVARASPVGSAADLAGRRVAVGEPGSASRTAALRVLQAHGLGPGRVATRDLPLREALVALRRNEVDAVIQVIGAPADSVREAIAQMPLRLVPLSEKAVAALAASGGGYFAYTLPRGAYPLQGEDVRTVATAALLLVGAGLTETEIAAITRRVYGEARDFAARGSAQGTQVAAANARLGLSVPQHLAAARALEALALPAHGAPRPAP